MKFTSFLLPFAFALLLVSCEEGSPSSNNTIAETPTGKTALPDTPAAAPKSTLATTRSSHDCKPIGKVLADNEMWFAEKEILFCIVADTAEVYDNQYPESHRHFQVYNTKICDLIGNHVMPPNPSPDYPYYLYKNTYEPENKILCAQGAEYVYCIDVDRLEMMLPLLPKYLKKRKASDANSGTPMGLTVWKNYLFGYASEYGCYAYNIADKKNPQVFMPVAEFLNQETGVSQQLFLVPDGQGTFQALYPTFDYDAGENAFQIKTLFDSPKPIPNRLSANVRNNRFLVFKYKDGSSAVGIDMEKGKLVDLPTDIASKGVQEILAWMKNR